MTESARKSTGKKSGETRRECGENWRGQKGERVKQKTRNRTMKTLEMTKERGTSRRL